MFLLSLSVMGVLFSGHLVAWVEHDARISQVVFAIQEPNGVSLGGGAVLWSNGW